MKRVISLALVIVLCLSLCACGGPARLTEEKISSALADCKGTLNLEKSGNKVVAFTYVVEDVNADDLIDKQYTRKAVLMLSAGNINEMTLNQLDVCKAFASALAIYILLNGGEESDLGAVMDGILGIICDDNTENYAGWNVSADVDQDADSITITVASEEAAHK